MRSVQEVALIATRPRDPKHRFCPTLWQSSVTHYPFAAIPKGNFWTFPWFMASKGFQNFDLPSTNRPLQAP